MSRTVRKLRQIWIFKVSETRLHDVLFEFAGITHLGALWKDGMKLNKF